MGGHESGYPFYLEKLCQNTGLYPVNENKL